MWVLMNTEKKTGGIRLGGTEGEKRNKNYKRDYFIISRSIMEKKKNGNTWKLWYSIRRS